MVLVTKIEEEQLKDPAIMTLLHEYAKICGKCPPPYNHYQWESVKIWIRELKKAIAKGKNGEAFPLHSFPNIDDYV